MSGQPYETNAQNTPQQPVPINRCSSLESKKGRRFYTLTPSYLFGISKETTFTRFERVGSMDGHSQTQPDTAPAWPEKLKSTTLTRFERVGSMAGHSRTQLDTAGHSRSQPILAPGLPRELKSTTVTRFQPIPAYA